MATVYIHVSSRRMPSLYKFLDELKILYASFEYTKLYCIQMIHEVVACLHITIVSIENGTTLY